MIILGLNSDDVGTQLEHLARQLLQHHGYQNIELNAVGAGGQELDVTAEFPLPNVGGAAAAPEQLIGECKAHQARIALPEWLKFIGKLHVAGVTTHQPRRGLFVALNGVNPNVRESFRQLLAEGARLTLLEGDDLLAEALQVFGGIKRAEAVAALGRMTSRQFVKLDVAYRDERLYWIFTFGDGSVAVLNSDGSVLTAEETLGITPHLNSRLENAPLVDLVAEKQAQERLAAIQKLCIASLFQSGGNQTEADLRHAPQAFSEAEVTAALKALEDRGWIIVNDEHLFRFAWDVDNDGIPPFQELLKFFLTSQLTGDQYEMLATSELFSKLVDDRALATIGEIQGALPLPNEDSEHILWLLRHSPSALAYALHPDPMIHTHRVKQEAKDEKVDAEDARRFLRTLLQRFAHDFRQPALAGFYYAKRQLVEVEVQQTTKIKSKDGLVLERDTTSRVGIGQWAEEHGGGLLLIEILSYAPEPWEWMKQSSAAAPPPNP